MYRCLCLVRKLGRGFPHGSSAKGRRHPASPYVPYTFRRIVWTTFRDLPLLPISSPKTKLKRRQLLFHGMPVMTEVDSTAAGRVASCAWMSPASAATTRSTAPHRGNLNARALSSVCSEVRHALPLQTLPRPQLRSPARSRVAAVWEPVCDAEVGRRPEVQAFLKVLHEHTEAEIRQGVLHRTEVGIQLLV